MKKIFFIITFFATLISCTKEDALDPLPLIVNGDFVRLDITSKRLEFQNLNTTYFGGNLTTPNANIEKYELFVRRKRANGILSSDYIKLLTVTNFPYDLRVTPQLIADAYNIPLSDLQISETYGFLAYATTKQGKVISYDSLSSVVRTQPGLKQAFRFFTDLEKDAVFNPDFNNYQNQ